MLKNRSIPFGYCVVNGKNALNASEAEAVRKIFSDYISGKSLKAIAAEMKIPYNIGKEVWNKIWCIELLKTEFISAKTVIRRSSAQRTLKWRLA